MSEPCLDSVCTTGVRPLRVLLAGGGTAGHVNPLLATAAALRSPELGGNAHTQIVVLGTQQGLEAQLVPQAGYELAFVPKVPMPRRPSGDLLRLPRRLRGAIDSALQVINALSADVVVGFGGYVAAPAYLAARKAGVPVVVHEQNARPGLANRLGARWAKAVALTFAATPLRPARGRTVVTGLPLRPRIAALLQERATPQGAQAARLEAAQVLGLDPRLPTLLVTGGSLGAQHLNEVLLASLAQLPENLQILHLTGRDKDASVKAALTTALAAGNLSEQLVAHYHVRDYLTHMEWAYACADGVMCRSGAGTVAELTALGMPALYVPLPIGNGEQRLNAAQVVAAGGGIVVADAALSGANIRAFTDVITDPLARAEMAHAAAKTGVSDGAYRLSSLIRSVANS